MKCAHFRFYAELNDLLPPNRRQVLFTYPFELSATVKDVIEALGIPHTEVDLILANGESVGFTYLVQDGDRISVYPVFESFDITELARVRPRPLREARFVNDTHLGRLAVYLRLLGFDTLYRNDYQDPELARVSRDEGRIALTRDVGLLKRNAITHGYWVRSSDPRQQLIEVLRRFDLFRLIAPFRRCLRCNGLLEPVSKEEIAGKLLPRTRQYYHEFHICRTCERVYWKGSHYQRMREFVERIRSGGAGRT